MHRRPQLCTTLSFPPLKKKGESPVPLNRANKIKMWNQRRRRLSSIINTHPSHTPPPPLIPRGLSVPHPIFLNLLSTPTPPHPSFFELPVIPLSAKREKRREDGGIDFFAGRFSQCGASLLSCVLRTVSGIDTAASVRPFFTQSEKGEKPSFTTAGRGRHWTGRGEIVESH